MKRLMDTEPVMVMALVGAFLGLLVAFNVPVTADQTSAILKFVEAALPFLPVVLGAMVARNRVYSPATMRKIVHEVEAGEVAQA